MVAVVEIVVVECQPHWQPLYDERRQFPARASPLLLRVFLYELLVYIASHQCQCLFLKVGRLTVFFAAVRRRHRKPLHGLRPLFLYLRFRLLRRRYAPHLVEGVHVERQVVQLPVVVRHGTIGEPVELHNGIDELPHLFVGGMEDVRAIFVHVDALCVLAEQVAAELPTLVNHQAPFAAPHSEISERRAIQPRANDEIVVFHFLSRRNNKEKAPCPALPVPPRSTLKDNKTTRLPL